MTFFEQVAEKLQSFSFKDAAFIIIMSALLIFFFICIKRCNAVWLAHAIIIFYALILVLSVAAILPSEALVLLLMMPVILTFILFSEDLKRMVFRLSWRTQSQHRHGNVELDLNEMEDTISQIVKAIQKMAKQDIGALIVIVSEKISDFILESGTHLNSDISSELIEALFVPKTPLHDGAVLIKGNQILAAGCYLPLSQATNIPKELGTRHRAAIGLTETDPSVTAIVVSEETGIISAMHDGMFKRYLDTESLTKVLEYAYALGGGQIDSGIWGVESDEEQG